jgi:hypothetical protein
MEDSSINRMVKRLIQQQNDQTGVCKAAMANEFELGIDTNQMTKKRQKRWAWIVFAAIIGPEGNG